MEQACGSCGMSGCCWELVWGWAGTAHYQTLQRCNNERSVVGAKTSLGWWCSLQTCCLGLGEKWTMVRGSACSLLLASPLMSWSDSVLGLSLQCQGVGTAGTHSLYHITLSLLQTAVDLYVNSPSLKLSNALNKQRLKEVQQLLKSNMNFIQRCNGDVFIRQDLDSFSCRNYWAFGTLISFCNILADSSESLRLMHHRKTRNISKTRGRERRNSIFKS